MENKNIELFIVFIIILVENPKFKFFFFTVIEGKYLFCIFFVFYFIVTGWRGRLEASIFTINEVYAKIEFLGP